MPIVRRPGSPPDPGAVPAPPPEHALLPLQVPEDTTPTWELEMLVSGAVLVGLFQLPPLLTGALAWLTAHLAGGVVRMLAELVVIMGRALVYVLIAAFVTHLASRAYWVALVGLDSVFPRGVRWERLRGYGPLTEGILRERLPTLPTLVSRLDNFCSIVFALGFLSAFFALSGVIVAALMTVIFWAVSGLLAAGMSPTTLTQVALLLLVVLVLPRRLDRRFGRRLAPDRLPAQLLRGAIRASYAVTAHRLVAPILLTLRTNLRRGAVSVIVLVLFGGGLTLSMVQMFAARGELGSDSLAGLPAAVRAAGRDYLFYADQRTGDDARERVPFIQSDVVRDPYVRLFIPYDPARDGPVLSRCPGAPSGVRAPASALLRCVAAARTIALDGRPRPDLDLRFYTDPTSGLSGVLAYIPVAGLPRGRNVITIAVPPAPEDSPAATPAPVTIPFWL